MKLKKGAIFGGRSFKGRIEVIEIDEPNNKLHVKLTLPIGSPEITSYSDWNEEWNLQHVLWGIEQKEYFLKQFPGYPEPFYRVNFTGYFDDNNHPICVGDKLKSEHGYEVIVFKDSDDASYYGQLVCDNSHSCKNIPYSLNEGKGHVIISKK